MREIGAMLWMAGLCLFGFATFLFDPSVGGSYGIDRVVNMDLQQRQLLLGVAGLTFFLAGAVIHALAELFAEKATVSVGVGTSTKNEGETAPSPTSLPPGVTLEQWEAELVAARAFNARNPAG